MSWSRKFDCCIGCGATDSRHEGKGLCSRCYWQARPKPEPKPKFAWSRDYEKCTMCGGTKARHAANGLCGNCYRRKGSPVHFEWSMEYERCVECGTTEKKHQGQGLCMSCYSRRRDRTRRTEEEVLTYKQPDWDLVDRLKNVSSGYLGFLEVETLRRLGYDG